jgi:FKBP-type peptidyl-prolyl cis-trans isomerase
MTSGIKIVVETEGAGAQAQKGDLVAFDCAAFLNKGTEVHPRRSESLALGARRFIAGIEAALVGMREGGYRKVRISPHLAYRAAGVEGKVPPNAVLIYELWLTSVQKRGLTPKSRGTRARTARAPHLER